MNPPPLPVRKRFPWILYWILFALIVLFAFAPMGSVMLCGWIANTYGCKVDEGLGASLHYRRTRLWRAPVFPRCIGLADARYSSRRFICFHYLADRSHPASGKLAKAIRCQFPVILSSVSAIESTSSKCLRLTQPLLQRARLDIKPNGAMHHRCICMMVGTGARKVDEKQNLRSKQFEIDCLKQLRPAQPPQQGREAPRHSEAATSSRLS